MQRRKLAFLLVPLLALAPVVAQQQDADKPKANKKRVRATLTDAPATPIPRPPAAPTPTPAAAPDSSAASAPASATAPATAAGTTPRDATPRDAGDAPRDAATTTSDTPGFEERIEVTEVQLDVVVRDKGKAVTGLGPEDFVVTEEGRPVEVTSARFYGAPEQLEATGEGEVERADRYFILLFHDRSRDAAVVRPLMLDAGQQARKWAAGAAAAERPGRGHDLRRATQDLHRLHPRPGPDRRRHLARGHLQEGARPRRRPLQGAAAPNGRFAVAPAQPAGGRRPRARFARVREDARAARPRGGRDRRPQEPDAVLGRLRRRRPQRPLGARPPLLPDDGAQPERRQRGGLLDRSLRRPVAALRPAPASPRPCPRSPATPRASTTRPSPLSPPR